MSTQAPAEKPKSDILDPKANAVALGRIVVLIFVPCLILGGAGWLFLRIAAGPATANRAAAVLLRRPVDLRNSTENVPASSWKAVPINLPYAGNVALEVQVKRGNPLDIYMISPDDLEKLKRKQSFRHVEPFHAQKAKSSRHEARLQGGSYYVVLVDNSLGVLSEGSSDVSVHARLE